MSSTPEEKLASLNSWDSVSWKKVNSEVTSLRKRIFACSRAKKYKQLRSLQKLLFYSTSNILFAIRKVTLQNSGRFTPGADNLTYLTPTQRWTLFEDLRRFNFQNYQSIPVKRIYVPKPDGRKRPIGLPTLFDRVVQQMVKSCLEPEHESYMSSLSYGFRPKRSVNDAINRIYVSLAKENSRTWVVELDLEGCFDNIGHDAILSRCKYFPFIHLIQEWLYAGILYESVFFDTDTGTPQGAVLSALFCNIALQDVDKEAGVKLINPIKQYVNQGTPSLIVFADDGVGLCYTRNQAEDLLETLRDSYKKRGLDINQAKSRIVHICQGFDFLGFHIKCLPRDGYENRDVILQLENGDWWFDYAQTGIYIVPSKKSIEKFKDSIKTAFKECAGSNAATLINKVNPIIRGWAHSKQFWHCNRVFHDLDGYIFNLCWRWMHRTHPQKNNQWLKETYFKHKVDHGYNNKWVFSTTTVGRKDVSIKLEMSQLKWFKPEQHIMIRNNACPDDPSQTQYFKELEIKRRLSKRFTFIGLMELSIAQAQNQICPVCGDSLFNGEELHKHHIISVKKGGKNTANNLIALHKDCHRAIHKSGETFIKYTTLFNEIKNFKKKSV